MKYNFTCKAEAETRDGLIAAFEAMAEAIRNERRPNTLIGVASSHPKKKFRYDLTNKN